MVENVSKNTITLRCDAVNTGRLPLVFSEKTVPPFDLIVEIDTTNWPILLVNHKDLIESAVSKAKINLSQGKIQKDLRLKIKIDAPPPPQSSKVAPILVEKKSPPPQETVDSPDKSSKIEIKKPSKTPDTLPIIINQEAEITLKEALPDLIIDTVWMVKMTKKQVTLGFVVKNIGDGTAKLGGESAKKDNDNLAINVYFSSSKKLSRGAMLADGIFISEKTAENGLLLPTERFYAEIKISLGNKTRFTQMVIFELDPFQTVSENNKTNNTKALQLPD